MRVPTWSHAHILRTALAAVGVAIVLVGAALLGAVPSGSTAVAPLHADSTPVYPSPIRHVVILYFENAEVGSVLANGSYFAYLADHYAFASQYYSVEHYSLPNYLAATSGITTNQFKVTKTKQIGDLVGNTGRTWGAFLEGMPYPCDPNSSGTYDINHNPFMMYYDVVSNTAKCDSHVVNFTAWNADVAASKLPNYSFVVPNNTDDGHDTNVSVANAWLQTWLPPLVNGSLFSNTVFFLTFDEGTSNLGINGGSGGGHIYMAAVSPYTVGGYNSTTQYDDYDLLTTTEWLLGLGHTGHNDNWTTHPPMEDLFSFPAKKPSGHAPRNAADLALMSPVAAPQRRVG
ncbi:MAG: alkaline phosphatase family protein [Thermoplasmata archaeon]|nr:alkaline phosphatase family protein [Thermoplasmata archaeon]